MASDNSDAPARPRKTLWFFVSIGILVVGFVVMNLLRALAPEPRQVEQPVTVPTVETVPLSPREGPLVVTGNGLVTPRADIALGAQVSGEVVTVHPQLVSGGRFARGDVLLQIDPRPYQASLDEARAARDAQQAQLDLLERQLERSLALAERQFVDENSIDDLRSRRDQARANLKRQEAVVLNREIDLDNARITAPFAGYVLSENVDVGDIVSPGVELARLYASDNMEVTVALDDEDAALIPDLWQADSAPRKAEVLAEFGGRRFAWPASVDRVEADLDQSTRTIDVVVRVASPQQPGRALDTTERAFATSPPPLLVGMYSTVHIEGMELPGHFVLPVSAVHDGHVWIVEGGSRLRIVPVEIVRQQDNELVLLAPELPAGTPIVVSNLAVVSDGMQVRMSGDAQ